MANSYFQFKKFTIQQDQCAMKVTTDSCLFGAWVARTVQAKNGQAGNALDIGSGTGLLSLMLAQKNPTTIIDAIEIDPAAAKQAEQNIRESPWKERINITSADVKDFRFTKKYDVIISNPPFYENELKSSNKIRNTAHHNESLLLTELTGIISDHLSPEGYFYLLLPYKRGNEIKKLLLNLFDITHMLLVRQSTKHDFFRIMLEGKLKSANTSEIKIEGVAITNDRKEYTDEFTGLLKEYYLHL
jgi:tRNA1Val (adenine37-N6)-methyltransferase